MVSLLLPTNIEIGAALVSGITTGVSVGIETGRIGGDVVNWFESALALLGDILDPIFPGGAGSELRPTSSKVTLATINAARKNAGLPPIGGRRRRRRALTLSDRADIAFISGTLGKPAGRDFAMIVAARSG